MASAPRAPGQFVMQDRPFIVGLLLSIVTLSFYHLWFHYRSHDELCRQMERENRESSLWITYGLLFLASVVVVLIGAAVLGANLAGLAADGEPSQRELQRMLPQVLGTSILMVVLLILFFIAGIILYIIYVAKQYDVLREARQRLGMPQKTGPGWFFGWWLGAGVPLSMILPFVGYIPWAVAYFNLCDHYRELHAVFREHPDAIRDGYRVPHAMPGAATTATGSPSVPRPAPAPAPFGGPAPAETPNRFRFDGRYDEPAGSASGHGTSASGAAAASGWPTEAPVASGPQASSGPAQPASMAGGVGGSSLIEQAFQCPRCHAHVTARGPPGTSVAVTCTSCGESGQVPLPHDVD